MRSIDPHIRMISRTTDDYARMAHAGCDRGTDDVTAREWSWSWVWVILNGGTVVGLGTAVIGLTASRVRRQKESCRAGRAAGVNGHLRG